MQFYTPKNFKNGKYILNRYRKIDVLILAIGIGLSFIYLFMFLMLLRYILPPYFLLVTIIPITVAIALTVQAHQKHNLLELLTISKSYYEHQRNFEWEGVHHFETD